MIGKQNLLWKLRKGTYTRLVGEEWSYQGKLPRGGDVSMKSQGQGEGRG
jgi:hypothetical protein